eukprot:386584_1
MEWLRDLAFRGLLSFAGIGFALDNHEIKSSGIDTNESKSEEPFIIGAGFGRSGTFSMKIALAKLGIRSSHFAELLKDRSKMHSIIEAANMKLKLRQKYQQIHQNESISNHDLWSNMILNKTDFNWDNIFRKNTNIFNATVDFPVCCFYLDLMKFYAPNYKVILTVRDNRNKWYNSVSKSIKVGIQLYIDKWLIRMLWHPTLKISTLCQGIMLLNTKTNNFWTDEALCKRVYDEWIESVKKNVPNDKLLIFNVKDGWKPLCNFLNVDIPKEEFPRSNDGETAQKAFAKMRLVNDICNVLIVVAIAAILYCVKACF